MNLFKKPEAAVGVVYSFRAPDPDLKICCLVLGGSLQSIFLTKEGLESEPFGKPYFVPKGTSPGRPCDIAELQNLVFLDAHSRKRTEAADFGGRILLTREAKRAYLALLADTEEPPYPIDYWEQFWDDAQGLLIDRGHIPKTTRLGGSRYESKGRA